MEDLIDKAETVQARARRAMAKVAAMEVRGWDGAARRAEELAAIDELLDEYNALA